MDDKLTRGWSDTISTEKECCYNDIKSEEELNRYTLSETLTTLERVKEILTYGDPIQRIAVYKNLPTLVKEPGVEEPLISLVVKQLENQDPYLQMEAGVAFTVMITEKRTATFGQKEFLYDLLDVVLGMLRLQNLQVIDAWIDVLKAIVKEVRFEDVSHAIVEEIYDLSGVCSPTPNKYSAMKIIAAVIQKMGNQLDSNLIDLIRLFSQVNDGDIKRVVVAEIWPNFFGLIQQPTLDIEWLPLVIDIIKDNSAQKDIRVAAINTMASTLRYYSPESKSDKIIPLIAYLIQLAQSTVLPFATTVSMQLGQFCFHLQDDIQSTKQASPIQKISAAMIQYIYQQAEATQSSEDVRMNCAYNFPCYFQVFSSKHKDKLISTFVQLLTKDREQKVRTQSVKSLFSIINQLSFDDLKTHFKSPIRTILNDTSRIECRTELCKRLPAYLTFLTTSPTNYQSLIADLTNDILNTIESNADHPTWRALTHLFTTLDMIAERNLFVSKDLCDKYLQVIFKCFDDGNFQLKRVAAMSFMTLIVHSKIPNLRESYLNSVQLHLLKSRTYHQRIIYLEIVDACILKFPRSFFKSANLFACTNLYSDRVPNVRRKLASMIVKIRNSMYSEDTAMLDTFDLRVIHLTSDRDTETSKIAQEQYSNLKDIDAFNRGRAKHDTTDLDSATTSNTNTTIENNNTHSHNNHFKHPRTFDHISDLSVDLPQERSIQSATMIAFQLPPSIGLPPKRRNINMKKVVGGGVVVTSQSKVTMSSPKSGPALSALNSSRVNAAAPDLRSPSQSSMKLLKTTSTVAVPGIPRPRRNSSNSSSEKQSRSNGAQHSITVGQQSSSSSLRQMSLLLPTMTQTANGKVLISQELNTLSSVSSYTSDKQIRKSSLSTHKNLKPLVQSQQNTNSNSINNPLKSLTRKLSETAGSTSSSSASKKAAGNSMHQATIENNPNSLSTSSIFRIKKTTASSPIVTGAKRI